MVEDRREVCLEEEVWRLRRAGMNVEGISAEMGVDIAWVEQILAMIPDEETPGAEAPERTGDGL